MKMEKISESYNNKGIMNELSVHIWIIHIVDNLLFKNNIRYRIARKKVLESHGIKILVISLLMVFLLVLFINSHNVEALRLVVHDEDEDKQEGDFLFTDENMKVLNQTSHFNDREQIKNATKNYTQINYIDLKNVKFFYDGNGTILADVIINNDTNYAFSDETTYGIAININSFPNPARPAIIDADYIYRSVYNKNSNTWFKVLGIQHSQGEEKPFSRPHAEPEHNFLNQTEHYVRMRFDTNNIGSPEEFQVQFFAWTKVNLSNSSTNLIYHLIDLTPWIEVPQPVISLSLNPEISKIYPQENKQEYVEVKSTSKVLSANIRLCQNEDCTKPIDCGLPSGYCWIFTQGDRAVLSPPVNFASVPVTLNTKKIDSGKAHLQMFADIYPVDAGVNLPDKKVQVWDLDVGDHTSEVFQGLIESPIKYPYIITIIAFIGGLFIDRKSVSSHINKGLERIRHSQTEGNDSKKDKDKDKAKETAGNAQKVANQFQRKTGAPF